MAGYRPKSLEELNDIYGKTIAAEKAIRKGTSLFEQNEKSDKSAETEKELSDADADEADQPRELSDAVSEFIAKYSADSPSPVQSVQTEKPKPLVTVMTKEPVKTEETPVSSFQPVNQDADSRQSRERIALRTDRDDLIDEYMKIMSDEDDDVPEKKMSRKDKKKKKKKALASSQPQDTDTPSEPLPSSYETDEEPKADNLDNLFSADSSQPDITEPDSFSDSSPAEEGDDFDFPENYTPEWIEKDIEEEEIHKEKTKGKKARKNKKDNEAYPEEAEVDIFPEDKKAEKEDEAVEMSAPEKEKKNKSNGLLKGLLSFILVIFIAAGILATAFETVLSVNTGKSVADNYYLFTAQKDYADLSVSEGDLIVTEKVYAEDGDVFAYIDYSEKTFELGKRTDSITNDDGEVLIVTESGGRRTLVARDDCKGVVYASYPVIGKYIRLVTDNYIAVMAAIAVAGVLIIVALCFLSKGRKAKHTDSEAEEASPEDEEENLFATID